MSVYLTLPDRLTNTKIYSALEALERGEERVEDNVFPERLKIKIVKEKTVLARSSMSETTENCY